MKKIFWLSFFGLLVFFSSIQNVQAADYFCKCQDGSSYILATCDECECLGIGVEDCDLIINAPAAPTPLPPEGPQELPNPLGITDVNALIARVINWILSLVGSVSLLMFVYGGLTWMTSAGVADKVKKGKDIIIWAVIGLAIVFTSYILVKFVITSLAGAA